MFAKYKFYIIAGLVALAAVYWFIIRKKKATSTQTTKNVTPTGTENFQEVWNGYESQRRA